MDEVRIPRIFVAISNAGKLETLKFSFSKKATKIWVIFLMLLTFSW